MHDSTISPPVFLQATQSRDNQLCSLPCDVHGCHSGRDKQDGGCSGAEVNSSGKAGQIDRDGESRKADQRQKSKQQTLNEFQHFNYSFAVLPVSDWQRIVQADKSLPAFNRFQNQTDIFCEKPNTNRERKSKRPKRTS